MRGPAIVLGILGSVVGAGFATGQEVFIFFTRYGAAGTAGVLLAAGGLAAVGCRAASFLASLPEPGLKQALVALAGEGRAWFWEAAGLFFLFASLSIMLAAGDALAGRLLGWGAGMGGAVLAAAAVIVLVREAGAVRAASAFLAGGLLVLTVTVAWRVSGGLPGILDTLRAPALPGERQVALPGLPWPVSALLYVAYNGFLALGSLAGWASGAVPPHPRGAGAWGFLGGALTGMLALLVHLALLANAGDLPGRAAPLEYLASREGSWLHAAYAANLAAALLVHLLVVAYGLGARLRPGRAGTAGALLVVAALPLSLVGFVDLVRTVYTGLAVLSLFLLPRLWRPGPGA